MIVLLMLALSLLASMQIVAALRGYVQETLTSQSVL